VNCVTRTFSVGETGNAGSGSGGRGRTSSFRRRQAQRLALLLEKLSRVGLLLGDRNRAGKRQHGDDDRLGNARARIASPEKANAHLPDSPISFLCVVTRARQVRLRNATFLDTARGQSTC
jgi:hypothetical protein